MHTTVSIPGMHCASCAALVKDVSSEFAEIKNTDVNMDTKIVTVDHDERLDMQKWTQEIESLGETYKVIPVSSV